MTDSKCPACSALHLEICRLNFELGKAQGALALLNQSFIVSNHEAWQQGREAGRHDRNPYPPKPEPEPKPEG